MAGYEKKYSEEEARKIGNANLSRSGSTGLEKNREGETYFKLKIIKKLERIRRSTFEYECLCECGQTVIAQYSRGKFSKKCCKDCLPVRVSEKKGMLQEVVDLYSTIRNRYRRDGAARGYTFELTNEQFDKLIVGDCHYCGRNKVSRQLYNSREVFYTGIDRVDNEKGYHIDNCVSCCKYCNSSKKAITKDMVEKIYKFIFGNKDE